MQLKVLILAYHFPPSNSSAAHRPESWMRYGTRYGFFPTILTRHWEGIENQWMNFEDNCGEEVSVEMTDTHEVIRLPYSNQLAKKKKIFVNPLRRKLYFFLQTLSGRFHTQTNINATFKPYLEKLLSERKFDFIIATAPPYQLYELAKDVSEKYQVPFVADIRDLWNDNRALNQGKAMSVKEWFNEKISRFYIFKWMRKASLITAVSYPMHDVFKKAVHVPFQEITNGFEEQAFADADFKKLPVFTLTLTGTIYPYQDFDILLEGFRKFLSKGPKAMINFIGISLFPQIEQKVRSMLPAEFIHISPRISKKEAIDLSVSSDVLFYVGWRGYKGFYSGKIFEYLAARRNILIAPSDHDVIHNLVEATNAGQCVDRVEDVVNVLENWYQEWLEHGALAYSGREEVIRTYSREQQTKRLANALFKVHKPNQKTT